VVRYRAQGASQWQEVIADKVQGDHVAEEEYFKADIYGLTPGTAGDHRGEIESVAAGNRRISELKRKISLLGIMK